MCQKTKKDIREGDWNTKEVLVINTLPVLTAKPVVYLCNLSEKDYSRKKNKWLAKIKQWVDENHPGDILIPYSGIVEYKLTTMENPDEKAAYLKELATKYEAPVPVNSAFNKIITTGYSAINLIYYFTGGADEVRAWTIRKNTKAPQAAGVIHTDFEKAFIMAETMSFDDLKEHESENAVKAAGKYKMNGREYVVKDGDILFFKAGQVNEKKK